MIDASFSINDTLISIFSFFLHFLLSIEIWQTWEAISNVLIELNLPPKIRKLIIDCVSSTSFNILWNGDRTNTFMPTRGIRQGDPLSPYLFVLCLGKLSHLVFDKVDSDEWVTLGAGWNGPSISHLFFVDDILLFGETSENQIDCMLECLNTFCNTTGQKVSNEKTRIFFSKQTPPDVKANIIAHTGFVVLIILVST